MNRRHIDWAACCLLLISVAPGISNAAPDPGRPSADSDQILLLEVWINGQSSGETSAFLVRNGMAYIPTADLKTWRLHPTAAASVVLDGVTYVPLSSLPGATAAINQSRQLIQLTIPAEDFDATALTPGSKEANSATSTPVGAVFLNYNVALEHDKDRNLAAAFVQAGVSDRWGLVTNNMAIGRGAGVNSTVRLETSYDYDDPDRLVRLTIGDAVTRGSDWIQPVRFAGVRYGTAFELQPNLVTFPTPSFFGRTALPSSVELYVNDVLRFRGDVDQGPFALNQVPLVTGAGQVSLLVHDALGVERQITSSYYVSSALLEPGLQDFAAEIGVERRFYGIRSLDYGNPFAAATYRRGVSDRLTLESRLELGSEIQDIGVGATLLWPALGEFGFAGAASESAPGIGSLFRASFRRISPRWNFSIAYQRATPSFRQIGAEGPTGDQQIRDQFQVSAGLSLGNFGDIGASYTTLRLGAEPATRIASLNYSRSIGDIVYLNSFVLRSLTAGEHSDTTIGVGLTIPFGSRSSGYALATSRSVDTEFQSTPPTDQGWGYRLAASTGQNAHQQADLSYRDQAGDITVQAARVGGDDAVRVLAEGGAVLIGGKVLPTRQLTGGFALVETPDIGGVRLYEENRPIGRTDDDGIAVITDLRPYELNKISLAPSDVPIEASLDSDVLNVTPRHLSGVEAKFNIARKRPATLIVRLETGEPLEVGTPVTLDGKFHLYTGYDGEVFAPSIHVGSVIEAHRRHDDCRVVIAAVPNGEAIPDIGPLLCVREAGRP